MSRSGYHDDFDENGTLWLYRQAVANAIRGKRGQKLMRDLVTALDAMPVKRLIAGELEENGEVCALGSVGKLRNIPMENLDPTEPDDVARAFGIATSLAREIVYENDEGTYGQRETPEERWTRIRQWAVEQLADPRPGGRDE